MPRLLFVDDEENLRFLFRKVFEKHAYDIETAEDFEQAIAILGRTSYDLVITDISMPGKSGIDLLKDIKRVSRDAYVILITGNPTIETATEAVRHGAFDYLIKPFNMAILEHVIENALSQKRLQDEKKRLEMIERKYVENLEVTLQEQTHEIRKAYKFLVSAHAKSLEILARAADYRDDDTGTHIHKIGEYCQIIARNLGLPENKVELLKYAAPMHDVGKIGIPDSILQKPGKLTPDEFDVIRSHTVIGAQIFFDSVHPYHIASGIIALTHHEKWDGSGYPRRTSGKNIHLFGRIVAVTDVFDALISKRVYKDPWTVEKALALISDEKGKHFDPEIAQCFLDSAREILEAKARVEAEEHSSPKMDLKTLLESLDQQMGTDPD